jgi:hypothetical protein
LSQATQMDKTLNLSVGDIIYKIVQKERRVFFITRIKEDKDAYECILIKHGEAKKLIATQSDFYMLLNTYGWTRQEA